MRVKYGKTVTLLFVFLNIVFLYYSLKVYVSFTVQTQTSTEKAHGDSSLVKFSVRSTLRHVSKLVTVIIRQFELYENDATLTAQSFLNLFPSIQLYIMYDELPYPPLDLTLTNSSLSNIKLLHLSPNLKSSFEDRYPISRIRTKYVLFVPDSTRATSRRIVHQMVTELGKFHGNIVVAQVNSHKKDLLKCLRINVSVREWTIRFHQINALVCDGVSGKHVSLLETETLKKLTDALILPFPQSLYIQTAARFIKVKILNSLSFHDGKPVIKSHHAQWKRKKAERERLKKFYELFKIKQVIHETGISEWYGCTRETSRCFGTVLDSIPSYLFEKKWTPPCCMSNLRKTAKHVFAILNATGVRYWLEAGSLLGAMRSGDILPWDYDVDIGFYRDDLSRCTWLQISKERPVIDNEGFLWEKATEGNFYRVNYSKVNKIYVNLFPFYPKNGTMCKDGWYTSHKNMEFPDSYLHPMSSLEFIGRNVPCPNNLRDFLEFKFGKGCIENPEYPNPSKLKFP